MLWFIFGFDVGDVEWFSEIVVVEDCIWCVFWSDDGCFMGLFVVIV